MNHQPTKTTYYDTTTVTALYQSKINSWPANISYECHETMTYVEIQIWIPNKIMYLSSMNACFVTFEYIINYKI